MSKFLTIVYEVTPSFNAKERLEEQNWTASSWSHVMHERDEWKAKAEQSELRLLAAEARIVELEALRDAQSERLALISQVPGEAVAWRMVTKSQRNVIFLTSNSEAKRFVEQGADVVPLFTGLPDATALRDAVLEEAAQACGRIGAACENGTEVALDCIDAVRALKSKLAQHATPGGYVLVPVVPTEDMLANGQEAWMCTNANKPAVEDCTQAESTYSAMLASRPSVEHWVPILEDSRMAEYMRGRGEVWISTYIETLECEIRRLNRLALNAP